MSQQNPNSEERQRMTDDAVRHALRSAPELNAKPQDDIEKLFARFFDKCIGARDKCKARIETGIQTNIIHSAQGRAAVLKELHEELLSALKDFDREELLFLMAWQQANWILQEHV